MTFVLLGRRRTYAIRRTRDAFRENKGLTDQNEISKQLETARRNLEVLKRQVSVPISNSHAGFVEDTTVINFGLIFAYSQKTVANLYRTHELIIEKVP